MNRVTRGVVLGTVVLIASGCYHATIETGLTPSPQTVEVPWAHGFLYGLVPPSTVSVQAACTSGVARVETQLSFVNQVANFLTLGIYTPMTIKATCAQGGEDQVRREGRSFLDHAVRGTGAPPGPAAEPGPHPDGGA